ncbi:putative zinc finger AN1 domain-containing stress-associated protein 12-like [Capsicum annuum]|nr:putative zinc finger AN1 domain-containing stress-associated protein 12-like [Capsicum annuum]
MTRPQVTITLGRSGQKVVKRSSASHSNGFGQQTLSRGKRSTDAEDPSLSRRKRVRRDKDAGGSRYGRPNDARVGQNDLRLKLMHRRRQREILRQIEERKKEQRKRTLASVQSAEQSQRRPVTSSQPMSRASELLQIEAIRSSYASHTAGVVRPRSPNRLAKDSREVASSSNITAAQHVPPLRPAEASRMVRMVGSDHVNPSQFKPLTPLTMRSALAARNPLSRLPSANGSMLPSPYPDQPPMTVTTLLNSLGLGKYAIHFQAEEVDMAALKQMGDRDLKDLGIPMGPRKKILLAMFSQTRTV